MSNGKERRGARARRTSAVSPVQGSRYLTSRWMTLLQKGQVGSRPCLRAPRRSRLRARPARRGAAAPSGGGSAQRAACSSPPRSWARERGGARARRPAPGSGAAVPTCRQAQATARGTQRARVCPNPGHAGEVGRAPVALRQPALDAGLMERVPARQRLARRRVARLAQPSAAARAADGRGARAEQPALRALQRCPHLRPAHGALALHALHLLARRVLRVRTAATLSGPSEPKKPCQRHPRRAHGAIALNLFTRDASCARAAAAAKSGPTEPCLGRLRLGIPKER